jgi:tetratricopeptide (TPR) repeat protein
LALAPRNPLILIPRILLEYEVGDFEGGEAYLKRLLEVASLTPPGPTVPSATIVGVIPLVARITGTTDRFDIAEAAAEAILSSPTSNPSFTQAARVGLALMAVQRADVAAAAEEYSALESRRGTFIPRLGFCYDHLLGLLAHTIGNLDQAMTHFEDALALCRKAGSRPELAWSCCDYADALFQRDGRGDRPKAMALLDESLLISRDLGMRPLMERVLARRDILKA